MCITIQPAIAAANQTMPFGPLQCQRLKARVNAAPALRVLIVGVLLCSHQNMNPCAATVNQNLNLQVNVQSRCFMQVGNVTIM